MNLNSLGKITVTTPGTPVQVKASWTPANNAMFAQIPGQTGNVYVGVAGMVKSTGVGVLFALLPAGASGQVDIKHFAGPSDSVDLSQFWIDADTAGQGVYVSYAVE